MTFQQTFVLGNVHIFSRSNACTRPASFYKHWPYRFNGANLYDAFMKMPSLYYCEKCGHPLNRDAHTVVRQATVWLKGKGKTVHSVITEDYRYIHEYCIKGGIDNDPTLF